jgi:hypothetical protein
VQKSITSAIKRVEFDSNEISYITKRSLGSNRYYERSCSNKDKFYDVKYNFYEELECVFGKFPK